MNIPAWTFGLAGGATGLAVRRPEIRIASYAIVLAANRIALEDRWVKNTAAFIAADAFMAIISQLMFGTDVGAGRLPGNGTENGTLPENGTSPESQQNKLIQFILSDLKKVYLRKMPKNPDDFSDFRQVEIPRESLVFDQKIKNILMRKE
jgi:hypothetical protein